MRIRHRILSRDPLCVECERKGRVTLATEVDHRIPLAQGGTDADENLQGLCHDCHAAKTARDEGKTRKRAIGRDGWPLE